MQDIEDRYGPRLKLTWHSGMSCGSLDLEATSVFISMSLKVFVDTIALEVIQPTSE